MRPQSYGCLIILFLLSYPIAGAKAQPIPLPPPQASGSEQTSQQAPEIHTKQESERPLNTEKQTQSEQKATEVAAPATPTTPAENGEEKGGGQANQGAEQGTEFWPVFYGVRMKITDSLIAAFTIALVIVTGFLVHSTNMLWRSGEKQIGIAIKAAEAANQAADAAIKANEQSREAYVADQRPWVSVKIEAGPIKWDANGCLIWLTFITKNVGRTPALYVTIKFQAYAPLGDFSPAQDHLVFADWMRNAIAPSVGFHLFPEQTEKTTIGTYVNWQQIDAWRSFWRNNGQDGRDYILPYVYGCAQYWSQIERRPYQTGFIYEINRVEQPAHATGISPSGGDIPAEHLKLQSFGGARVD